LPNAPHPSMFSYPPPRLPAPLTNVVGSHHHHQQSYGVVNNFIFSFFIIIPRFNRFIN
ncbi:unnamed protein product, partial [Rotaria socialis]